MIKISTDIFKAYDIRGLYPEEINEEGAYLIGLAYTQLFKPKNVVIGQDVREANGKLKEQLIKSFLDSGVEVIDIGLIPTDMLYFVVGKYGYDGGIAVSASHNPAGYAGMKMVGPGAEPIFQGNGLEQIKDLVLSGSLKTPGLVGKLEQRDFKKEYFDFILSFIDVDKLKPQKVVVNPNFGLSGKFLEEMIKERNLPLEIVPLNMEPDGTFPKGRPDPMIPEGRTESLALAKDNNVDFGVSWDADGDRAFFYDGQNFYEPCYVTAVLVENLLKKYPGAKILYDVRYALAIRAAALENGGEALMERVGHSFIKARMRKEDAVFCGESSGHYYFKDNFYCDNGFIPFLLLWEELSVSGKSLAELVEPYTSRFFVSGEFNTKTSDAAVKLEAVEEKYKDGKIDHIDGVTVEYPDWRFNLRTSNTEVGLVRCNIEGLSAEVVEEKKAEILELLTQKQ